MKGVLSSHAAVGDVRASHNLWYPALTAQAYHKSAEKESSLDSNYRGWVYRVVAVAKLGLCTRPGLSGAIARGRRDALSQEGIHRTRHGLRCTHPPGFRGQVPHVSLVRGIAQCDQHGWHVRRFQDPKTGRFQRSFMKLRGCLHIGHQEMRESVGEGPGFPSD